MMENMVEITEYLKNNVVYLSALAQYNSERMPYLRMIYENLFRDGSINKRLISFTDISMILEKTAKEFYENRDSNYLPRYLRDYYLFRSGEMSFINILEYISNRYSGLNEDDSKLNDAFYKKYGTSIHTFVEIFEWLTVTFLQRQNDSGFLHNHYAFNSKSEYGNLAFLSDVEAGRVDKWKAIISIDKKQLINEILEDNESFIREILGPTGYEQIINSGKEQIRREIETALELITVDVKNQISYESYFHITKPILKINEELFVPFPYIVPGALPFILDVLIHDDDELENLEDKNKGELTEAIVTLALNKFKNKNLLKNIHYIKANNSVGECDSALFLNNSIWAIEVKSHSLFKKFIYNDIGGYKVTALKKISDGLKQGKADLAFFSSNPNLLYNLGYPKSSINNLKKGIIVVLDSFVPTIFSQNESLDKKIFGLSDLYDNLENYRLFVISALDLLKISSQYDKDNLEEFLLWRTCYPKKFPIFSLYEEDIWAYFDGYKNDNGERKNAFDSAMQRQNVIFYNSARFGDKSYLKKFVG